MKMQTDVGVVAVVGGNSPPQGWANLRMGAPQWVLKFDSGREQEQMEGVFL